MDIPPAREQTLTHLTFKKRGNCYRKVRLMRPTLGLSKSGLSRESVFIARPHVGPKGDLDIKTVL